MFRTCSSCSHPNCSNGKLGRLSRQTCYQCHHTYYICRDPNKGEKCVQLCKRKESCFGTCQLSCDCFKTDIGRRCNVCKRIAEEVESRLIYHGDSDDYEEEDVQSYVEYMMNH